MGYVGLPVALAFDREGFQTIGFDADRSRVDELSSSADRTGEATTVELKECSIAFTDDANDLAPATFYIVAVPTPIDDSNQPDLRPLRSAMESIGRHLTRNDVVVVESTVYPGVTEEFCAPILEQVSGLVSGTDFFMGYSPERINPGDKEHRFDQIVKVVSGQTPEILERVAGVYGTVVKAGVHQAPSIRVAEAAKVIENTQRDLNIALMNELSIIFDRMNIRTQDVLEAAGTKWNFLRFVPGLVGGHCIGVDPYYLTSKAIELGYHPQVILAGRRINDDVGRFVARRTVKLLSNQGLALRDARVAILGLTFKENVPDVRNSRVPNIAQELRAFGCQPIVHDPLVEPKRAHSVYGLELADWSQVTDLDAMIYAVGHDFYRQQSASDLLSRIKDGGLVVDVKSLLHPSDMSRNIRYWSL